MFFRFIVLISSLFFMHTIYAEEKALLHGDIHYAGASSDWPIDVIWSNVELPFSRAGKEQKEYIWFRFNADDVAGYEAFYVQSQVFDFDVYLNQERLGGTTRHDGLQATGWNHPFFLEITPSLWKKENNYIYVRLRDGQPNAILSPMIFGNADKLKSIYKKKYFLQVTVAGWSLMACLLMGALTLFIWFWRRQDMKYLYFSLVCFSWSIVMTYLLLPYSPIEHVYWLKMGYFCVDLSALWVVMFINRLVNLKIVKLERLMIVVTMFSGLVIFTMPIHQHNLVTSITHSIHCLFVFYILACVVYKAIRYKYSAAIWTSCGLACMGVIMIRDIYVFIDAYSKPQRLPESTMMQYGFGILLLVMFIYLIKTFVDALNETEQINENLEKGIRQAKISMEQAFAEKKALEIEATTQRERQKIYRDLHDDVGAKLVSIVHSGIENSQTALAREALVSLREVVAQNNYQYQQLTVLMRAVLAEMESRLLAANINFSASGVDDLPDLSMSPGVGYHISRIFREIITNVIKHADAGQVYFQCQYANDLLCCNFEDNGNGLPEDLITGSGMSNIRYRADEIAADVFWDSESSLGGCAFKLFIPLASHSD